ncbi:hypothetical protein LT85_2536 [Collimonas arenae]|uniref:Uncharacterized protein n=1 Tax=Collimonas arenae TaxID=279058 RepID=A0A0A1FDE1_9BURK|nr:hypothetical protein [Collimonas arenae]AIY41694.1 hypothetical protein LT85_2536 [Collimonas arenae]
MKSKLEFLRALAAKQLNRATAATTVIAVTASATGLAHADGGPDVSAVVTYIMGGLAAIALIGVAKMTIAAAPAAYQSLMGFIKSR